MAKKRATADTIVGLFVFLGIVAINLVTFVIREDLFGGTTTVRVRFESVSGLEVGAPVLVSGIRAGRVTRIQYEPVNTPVPVDSQTIEYPVVVTIVVDEDIPVYTNGRIRLVTQGFIGDKRVEIDPGSPEFAQPVGPETPPLRGEPQFDMEKVIRQAELMVDDLSETVRGFREFVSNDANLAAIGETIDNLNMSVQRIHLYLANNEENIQATITNLREISANMATLSDQALRYTEEGGEIDQVTADIRETLNQLQNNMNALTEESQNTIVAVRDTVQNLDQRSQAVSESAVSLMNSARQDIAALSADLQQTSNNLDLLITKIHRGEGTIGRAFTDPTPFEDLKASIAALRNFIIGQQTSYRTLTIPYENTAPPQNAPGTVNQERDTWYDSTTGPGEN